MLRLLHPVIAPEPRVYKGEQLTQRAMQSTRRNITLAQRRYTERTTSDQVRGHGQTVVQAGSKGANRKMLTVRESFTLRTRHSPRFVPSDWQSPGFRDTVR